MSCLGRGVCGPGTGWRCGQEEGCQDCPLGSWQSDWGGVCWPCPPNTTTDRTGATSLDQCKLTSCGRHTSNTITVLSSPNYPGNLPLLSACSWTLTRRQDSAGLLVILPSLSLPPNCSHSLTVWAGDQEILSSCLSLPSPRLLYTSTTSIRVSLSSSAGATSGATGFQMTVVSVPRNMGTVMEVMTGSGSEAEMISKLVRTMYQYSAQEQRKLSRPRPVLEVTRERKNEFVVVEKKN